MSFTSYIARRNARHRRIEALVNIGVFIGFVAACGVLLFCLGRLSARDFRGSEKALRHLGTHHTTVDRFGDQGYILVK